MNMQAIAVAVRQAFTPMVGGLDLVTPTMSKKPGTLRSSQNFEQSVNGGYRRIAGYERYSGKASPSDATYTILAATITGAAAVGNTLTGATSAATGVIIALPGGSFVMTTTTGTFVSGENLTIGGTNRAVSTAAPVIDGASTPLLHATYRNLAADVYRAPIAAVPGEDDILGVVQFSDIVYAFRNAVGGLTAAIYKSSGTGWTAVPLGRQVSFTSGGTYVIAEGNTITGATSAATAVITRVVLTSGSWAAGTAAGKLIFASQTGTFQAENLDVGGNLNVATIAGNSSAITLLPDGRFEFDIANMGGAANTKRIYGCDGVNKGFEFDGAVFVPIDTGMATDAPSHVKVHKNHLFLSFVGSVQHSAPGQPYVWSAIVGAAELAMGDTVTGFARQPGSSADGALAIFTRNRLSILYGNSVSDWNLVPYRDEIGAFANTIQDAGKTVFLDDRGITDIQTTQAFGNFAHATLSDRIRTRLNEYRAGVVSSSISRDLSQYRIFFTSGYGFYMTMVGKNVIGIMPVLFPDVVRCIWSGEKNDGTEAIFFGSAEGYVYQMEKGTSFDGDSIEHFIEFSYDFAGSPRVLKSYRHAMLEVEGTAYASFSFGYVLGYSSTNVAQPDTQAIVTNFSATYWDLAGYVWDIGVWDGQTLTPSEVTLEGDAENISLAIYGDSDMYEPFTITGAVYDYTPRRIIRG